MLVKKAQQVFAPDHRDLQFVQRFRRDFVSSVAERRAQAKRLSRNGDAQGQMLTRFGRHRQAYASFAQHAHASRRLSFSKKDCTPGNSSKGLNAVKGLQHARRQIAEEAIRT